MQKDFSPKRANKAPGKKAKPGNKKTKLGSAKGGSNFLVGLVSGAALGATAVALYSGMFSLNVMPGVADEQNDGTDKPTVVFTFPSKLAASSVAVDPSIYGVPGSIDTVVYDLQVASLISKKSAEELRAYLILESFQAKVAVTNGGDGGRYKVIVGSFDKKVKAERARTALRALGLKPILVSKATQEAGPQ